MRTVNSYLITCIHRNEISPVIIQVDKYEFTFEYEFTGRFNIDLFRQELDALIEAKVVQPRETVELSGCYFLHSETLVSRI